LRILIVEDEIRAANRLERLIKDLLPESQILAKIASVSETVDWLNNNETPDLLFFDIRLEDGESFDILKLANVTSPIIFCTAYSDYSLQAFTVNSIDYLLKPIVKEQLARALAKYSRFTGYKIDTSMWPSLLSGFEVSQAKYRQQFLIAKSGTFVPLKVSEIVAVYSYYKSSMFVDVDGKEWFLDEPLSTIESSLDLNLFFRVNRQWIVKLSEICALSKKDQRHYIKLAPVDDNLRVSRAKVRDLKNLLLAI